HNAAGGTPALPDANRHNITGSRLPAGMKTLLVVNESAGAFAGTSGISAAELRAALAEAGVRTALRAAVAEQPDTVIVAGGDGTISTAAGCLAGSGIALGVLPLGTLNHFARDLGLATDWRDAIATL